VSVRDPGSPSDISLPELAFFGQAVSPIESNAVFIFYSGIGISDSDHSWA
jgi:hypothetical protein